MSNTLYITSNELKSGKSIIALGLIESLFKQVKRTGYFKPILRSPGAKQEDHNFELITEHFHLERGKQASYAFTKSEANALLSDRQHEKFFDKIVSTHKNLQKENDFVLCDGTDYDTSSAAFLEFDINVQIAKNLASPMLLVTSAKDKNPADVEENILISHDTFSREKCELLGVIINRVDPKRKNEFIKIFF